MNVDEPVRVIRPPPTILIAPTAIKFIRLVAAILTDNGTKLRGVKAVAAAPAPKFNEFEATILMNPFTTPAVKTFSAV